MTPFELPKPRIRSTFEPGAPWAIDFCDGSTGTVWPVSRGFVWTREQGETLLEGEAASRDEAFVRAWSSMASPPPALGMNSAELAEAYPDAAASASSCAAALRSILELRTGFRWRVYTRRGTEVRIQARAGKRSHGGRDLPGAERWLLTGHDRALLAAIFGVPIVLRSGLTVRADRRKAVARAAGNALGELRLVQP